MHLKVPLGLSLLCPDSLYFNPNSSASSSHEILVISVYLSIPKPQGNLSGEHCAEFRVAILDLLFYGTQREKTKHTFEYGKEREEAQKHKWLQVEHGVNGILEACRTGHGKFCQAKPVDLCLPSLQLSPEAHRDRLSAGVFV